MVNGKKSRRSECMPSSYLWRRGSSLYDTKGQCQAEKGMPCHQKSNQIRCHQHAIQQFKQCPFGFGGGIIL
eukprot:scaffold236654_cov17-Tisochrysis_lutea.AAC.1